MNGNRPLSRPQFPFPQATRLEVLEPSLFFRAGYLVNRRKTMGRFLRIGIPGALLVASLLGTNASAAGGGYVETDLVVDQEVDSTPQLTDANGIVHKAKFFDPNLVNPWGIAESGSSPFWVSDNGKSLSTTYNSAGTPLSLVVSIPAPGDPLGASGTPTGVVFNIAGGGVTPQFMISGFKSDETPTSAAAAFLFAAEDGTILGWNGSVNPSGATNGRHAIIAVDNSPSGAIYKGLAVAIDSGGTARLYATNFAAGTVDVFDGTFNSATGLPRGRLRRSAASEELRSVQHRPDRGQTLRHLRAEGAGRRR
jgi:hypothetical protein